MYAICGYRICIQVLPKLLAAYICIIAKVYEDADNSFLFSRGRETPRVLLLKPVCGPLVQRWCLLKGVYNCFPLGWVIAGRPSFDLDEF